MLLIRVMAASVNPVDVAIRSGKYAQLFPHHPAACSGHGRGRNGRESGEQNHQVETGRSRFMPIFTLRRKAGYAEFALAKENEVARKPTSITYEQAAAVPAAGSTAWQAWSMPRS